jgi:flagellar biogenesis protein FliO
MEIFSAEEWLTILKSICFLVLLSAAWVVLTRRSFGAPRTVSRTLAVREQLLLTRDTRVVVITRGAAHEWVLAIGPHGMQLLAAGGRKDSRAESASAPSGRLPLRRVTTLPMVARATHGGGPS